MYSFNTSHCHSESSSGTYSNTSSGNLQRTVCNAHSQRSAELQLDTLYEPECIYRLTCNSKSFNNNDLNSNGKGKQRELGVSTSNKNSKPSSSNNRHSSSRNLQRAVSNAHSQRSTELQLDTINEPECIDRLTCNSQSFNNNHLHGNGNR